ncbi:MAG TPA: sigma 54-interacting transcriptional regulator [Vicinamibacterales bacterium]|nr:sigma 54-interacting transcriptional regulator [Vicinamibacterales bacterium]
MAIHSADRVEQETSHDVWQTDSAMGGSPCWRDVVWRAQLVAMTDTTTCLQGESGSGKEVVARLIHRMSRRRRNPFVAVNCAALPEQLLESELFGYERGAFTGADHVKVGQFEIASGGTLFLDEISEMPLLAQAKCLRVLQEREFLRLGGTRPIKADVRVIAATNRDLSRAVAASKFREDLFYRINVFDIRIPPLRERREDLMLLTERFLAECAQATGRVPAALTAEAKEALLAYRWPGNVRELRNVIERATILCEDSWIRVHHLPSDVTAGAAGLSHADDLGTVERQAIERVMLDTKGNKALAARRLGISRSQLYWRLSKYGLCIR